MRSALMLGTALALGACNISGHAQESDGGGGIARRDFQVGNFDRIALAGSHDVIVTVGGAPSVRAEGDAKAIERLEIEVEGGKLKIGSRNHVSLGFSRDRGPVKIHVTVPSLTGAAVAGSGDLKIDKVEGSRFSGAVAGSGDLDIGAMKVEQAEFTVGGSGGIRAAGTAADSKVSVAGSGDLHLEALEVRRANVSVAGSGGVKARAMETADVSVAGSGDVTLSGPARCNVRKSGSGQVRCTG